MTELAGRLQQHVGPVDIGPHERAGVHQRPVDMRFGGEVHDGIRVLRHRVHVGRFGDIAPDEAEPGIAGHLREVFFAARIGQLVQHRDLDLLVPPEPVSHEGGADEPGATGDQQTAKAKGHQVSSTSE